MRRTKGSPTPKDVGVLQAEPGQVVVEMVHLNKSFGTQTVLKDINLSLYKGENLVLLGQSGTGKSVLIKCIVGLDDVDDGQLILFGQNVADLSAKDLLAVRRKIGFLFQSGALYDSMSVRENLEFPLERLSPRPKKKEMAELIAESLEDVGLSDAIGRMPSELSGGMRKRLGLARTLILRPEVMLYDEPTTGLDPITSREISTLILDVQRKYATSSIIITHDIECARLTANRIIVIKDGICSAEGSFDELKRSKDAWVRSFFD